MAHDDFSRVPQRIFLTPPEHRRRASRHRHAQAGQQQSFHQPATTGHNGSPPPRFYRRRRRIGHKFRPRFRDDALVDDERDFCKTPHAISVIVNTFTDATDTFTDGHISPFSYGHGHDGPASRAFSIRDRRSRRVRAWRRHLRHDIVTSGRQASAASPH